MAVGLRSPGRDLKGTSIQNAHKEYRRTCFPRLVQLSDPLASQCHPRECHHQPYQSRPGLLPVLSLRAPEGRHTKVFLRLPWQTSTSSPPQRPCQHCALSSVVVQFRTSPAPRALHARPCSIIVIGFGPAAVNYLAAGEAPRRRDKFEAVVEHLPEYRKGFHGLFYGARTDPDAEWQAAHAQLGNGAGEEGR